MRTTRLFAPPWMESRARAEQDILAKCVFAGKIEEELMDEYMDSDIADMDTEAERLDGAKA